MIRYAQGDIFDTPADIRVNTVNCVGVMGAGVALAFKNRYPEMFKKYAKACKAGEVRPGNPHVWEKSEFDEIVTVVNLPTKDHWRQPSEYEYVEKGLRWLHEFVEGRGKVRVALPALGCGHGGLDWLRVQKMIEAVLGDLAAEIIVFEPSSSHAAGERLDESTLARLEELGIKRLRSGDPGYPEALRGRSGATVYLKGNVEALSGPMVAVIPSIKPTEREIQGVVACVRELANPSVRILTGYSAKADRPVIRTALEQGAHVIICLVEGILLFNIRRDLQDIWDENRVTVISAAKPQQKWYPGGVGKATAIKLSLADAALISDPSPKWLSSFVRNGTNGIRSKMFYLDYGGMQENIKASLRKLQAKPLGRSRESGKPNVVEVLAALQLTDPPQEALEITSNGHKPKVENQASAPIEKTEGEASVTYPKRLIEMDLPIKRISAHSRREKSIRHGHISTLHIWWARRPLAACRAVVCASLWPDPGDDICPTRFVETAKRLMFYWGDRYLQKCSADSYPRFNKIAKTPVCLDDGMELRKALLDFIADFADWDNSTSAEYLAVARALTIAAHDALESSNTFSLPESITIESLNDAIKDAPRPLLVDPFAGGGAIPLEGLRCGADAFASDLQDIPVALNKTILEDLNETSGTITKDYLSWANKLNERVAEKLHKFYRSEKKAENIFAYFWARTVVCEGPGCGKTVPLIGNPHLSRRESAKASIVLRYPEGQQYPEVILSNYSKGDAFQTVKGGNVLCPCGYVTSVKSVRQQLSSKNGGADDAFLLAVGFMDDNGKKQYRLPSKVDLESREQAIEERQLYSKKTDINSPLSPFPNEKLWGKSHMNVGLYGLTDWSHVFTSRQLILLRTYQEELAALAEQEADQLTHILTNLLSLTIDKIIDYSTSLTRWVPGGEFIAATLGSEKKLPMMWDFTECVSTGSGPGSWKSMSDWIARVIDHIKMSNLMKGTVIQCDARESSLPSDSVQCLFTDPPYYDAIWYGDLSDLFTVWYRRTISLLGLPIESDEISIKEAELIKSSFSVKDGLKNKDDTFYENGMRDSLETGREVVQPSGLGVVVFAHKSTSGWESVLQATIDAGWTVTSSWPIDTEREARMTSIGQAALGSSIHLVLRPREDVDGNVIEQIGDWRDVLSELPGRIAAWLPRLASEGVVGADAIFACLGPALEIFSRYSAVEKASGEVVPLREYLEQVWAEVARQALNMIFEGADASGFEEDARLTAMWLWTLRTDANGNGADDDKVTSLPGYTLEYDAARKIAQGLGCHLENLTHLVEVKRDKAMLLSAESRAPYLFGKEDARATAKRRKKKAGPVQQDLFSLLGVPDEEETAAKRAELERPPAGKTALDQLHQSMLLFTAGRGVALKRFLVDDGIGANPQFWTLAQALSALYPSQTNEKRWVDGVLARKKGLGF